MYTRVVTMRVGKENVDSGIRFFEERTLPQVRQVPGFKGATLLVDHESGITRAVTFWNSSRDLEASTEIATRLRSEFVGNFAGAEILTVEVFEVAVDVGEWEAQKAA